MPPEAFQTIRSITTSFLNPRSLPLMGCAICTGSAHAGPHTDPPERVLHWNPVKIDDHFVLLLHTLPLSITNDRI